MNPSSTSHPVKIIQISDPHLLADPAGRYRDLNVDDRFRAVLDQACVAHPDAGLILLTGDICQQSDINAYRRVVRLLSATGIRWHWIPGNHDDRRLMDAVATDRRLQFQLGGWQVTLLDSTSEPDGRGSGTLHRTELRRLEQQLRLPGFHLIVVHHNPIGVNSAWQDAIAMANAGQFCALLQQSDRQGVVVFGHIHQVRDVQLGRWRLLSCPSTAVQFRKDSDRFALEVDGAEALPGYRWLRLADQGQVETGIERCVLA